MALSLRNVAVKAGELASLDPKVTDVTPVDTIQEQIGDPLDVTPDANRRLLPLKVQVDIAADVTTILPGEAMAVTLGYSVEPVAGPAKTSADVQLGTRTYTSTLTHCTLNDFQTKTHSPTKEYPVGEAQRFRFWMAFTTTNTGNVMVSYCIRNRRVTYNEFAWVPSMVRQFLAKRLRRWG